MELFDTAGDTRADRASVVAIPLALAGDAIWEAGEREELESRSCSLRFRSEVLSALALRGAIRSLLSWLAIRTASA